MILGSFYNGNAKSEAERWRMIIETLRELGKEAIIEQLGLNEIQARLSKKQIKKSLCAFVITFIFQHQVLFAFAVCL